MTQAIYTGTAARLIDRLAISDYGYAGLDLMVLAGETAFQLLCKRFKPPASKLVACGYGNNGGDGYVLATCALQAGWQVTVVAIDKPETNDACSACDAFIKKGGSVLSVEQWPLEVNLEAHYDVVVDALLGVGIQGAPREPLAGHIAMLNQLDGYKLAVDVPSGVNADTGEVYQPGFAADQTITYIVPKLGLLTGAGKNQCGELTLETLGIDNQICSQISDCATYLSSPLSASDLHIPGLLTLLNRPPDSHKGDYGHVVIAGGDNGMLGAVLLAGQSALRCGVGKVHVLSTEQHLDQAALATPELMTAVFDGQNRSLFESATVVAVGPGLGLTAWSERLFETVIALNQPLVIDADALTLLAATEKSANNGPWVLTPHPGEAARLLGCSTSEVQTNRYDAVVTIARERNAVCILKGAGTLIADQHGDVFLCDKGNPGMATAGMGDVLTGMIAALMAQSVRRFTGHFIEHFIEYFIEQELNALESAKAAVWLHASAADKAALTLGEASLIASDIVDYLPDTINGLSTRSHRG